MNISEEPEKFFARKEIPRTVADIERFKKEIYGIYSTIKFLEETNSFWSNEVQCEATFKCPYIQFCYNNVTLEEGDVPDGFRRTYKIEEDTDKETK